MNMSRRKTKQSKRRSRSSWKWLTALAGFGAIVVGLWRAIVKGRIQEKIQAQPETSPSTGEGEKQEPSSASESPGAGEKEQKVSSSTGSLVASEKETESSIEAPKPDE